MTKHDLLVFTASLYVGVKETETNMGDMVNKFQSSTKTIGQPWCVSYVQHCIRAVDTFYMGLNRNVSECTQIPLTASVVQLINGSPSWAISNTPRPGFVALWRFYKDNVATSAGHCGIVQKVENTGFLSYEGNTKDSADIVREGDGVFLKRRSLTGSPTMKLVGFLDPWFQLSGGKNG